MIIKSNKDLTKSKKIIEYIKPVIVYIPLENKMGVKYKHLVKEGDYIYKGQVVAVNPDIDFPIHSSVSGYVIQGIKKTMLNGEKIKCIVVENDFKERYEIKTGYHKKINNYSKQDFIIMLKNSGITGLGGSDFPTFIKYNTNKKIKCLIINAVECEAYVTCDDALIKEHCEQILEGIDAIMDIMEIRSSIIVASASNDRVIKELMKYLGTYPDIKLRTVSDDYPSGWERLVIKETLNLSYKKYPSEIGVIVNNVSTIYAIYEMLKYNRPLTERIITITGNGVRNPVNIKVKIGALMSEIISYLDGYKSIKNLLFIAGGGMMGTSISSDDLVITKDLNCVIVKSNEKYDVESCIKCGRCSKNCPVKLVPILIKENLNNKDQLKKLTPSKCIECGLCSYVCPAKIELREFVRIAKGESKNE